MCFITFTVVDVKAERNRNISTYYQASEMDQTNGSVTAFVHVHVLPVHASSTLEKRCVEEREGGSGKERRGREG